ncbi:LysM peptidoglycan-binding domain-containing protein [Arcicella rosea]|uniref:LysM repeat protein n=1 Tax=Arcicella rosea TaxID=502909 RepID=A0A841EMV7_9BACT|nr:LysM peptidoglycan-binding domain-containing protein [Arcicella rosea]MBB6005022.1 LysM repeat protein [Arcicella rosea]
MKYNTKSVAKIVSVFLLSATYTASFAKEISLDSVTVRKEEGKTYVIHKVEPRQTLYSILRKYGSSMSEFRVANPGISDNVNIGQIVKVPYNKVVRTTPSKYTSNSTAILPPEPSRPATHTVEQGQGLYGISSKYKVPIADLRRWNNLTNDQLTAGQVLIIDAREYERKRYSNTDVPTRPADVNREPYRPVTISEQPKVASKTEEPVPNDVKTSSEVVRTASGYRRTIETGLAELIDVEDNSGKYLALHRSAGVGTLVNVKNIANGQSIWVKVVGKLPDIGSDKVIIKLSPRAFEKLNPTEKRIRTELNYMTP